MKINYGRQYIDKADIKAVSQALSNELTTTGENVKKFEKKLVNFFQSKYVISCNSGTSAILMSLLALNLRKNSNVIIPSVNFIAAANLCKNFGYNIFFSDIDPSTGQITPYYVDKCINQNKIKKVDLIFTMHLGGNPENVLEFYKLKKKLKCFLVEDACHAFGATYKVVNKNYKIGSCQHSDIACFSFHPLKNINVWSDGGIITTNNKKHYYKLKLLRNHGLIDRDTVKINGYNSRLDTFQAVVGNWLLPKAKLIAKKRIENAKYYDQNFSKISKLIIPFRPKNFKLVYHLYIIFAKDRDKLLKYCLAKGIEAKVHYPKPMYLQESIKYLGHKKGDFPITDRHTKEIITFPCDQHLSQEQMNYVIKCVKNFYKKKTKL